MNLPFAGYLIDLSLRSVPVVAAALAVSIIFRRKHPVFQYNLWLVVLLRFLLPPTININMRAAGPVEEVVRRIPAGRLELTPVVVPGAEHSGLGSTLNLLWLAAVIILLFVIAWRYSGLRRITSGARLFEREIPDGRLLDLGGVSRRTRILTSPGVTAPFVTGLFRPRIYLPEQASGWEMEDLIVVIRHELAHAARMDLAEIAIQNIVQVCLFFNPLVWLVNYRLNYLREVICDEISLAVPDRS